RLLGVTVVLRDRPGPDRADGGELPHGAGLGHHAAVSGVWGGAAQGRVRGRVAVRGDVAGGSWPTARWLARNSASLFLVPLAPIVLPPEGVLANSVRAGGWPPARQARSALPTRCEAPVGWDSTSAGRLRLRPGSGEPIRDARIVAFDEGAVIAL